MSKIFIVSCAAILIPVAVSMSQSQSVPNTPTTGVINVLTDCPGIVADGCTDDGPAINACLLDQEGRTFYFPRVRNPYTQPQVDYYSAETIQTKQGQTLYGDGSYGKGTRIAFSPDCRDNPAPTTPTVNGVVIRDEVTLKNVAIMGDIKCSNHNLTVNPAQVPFPAPGGETDGLVFFGGKGVIEQVRICAFGRDGIHMDDDGGGIGTTFINVMTESNYRYGVFLDGADAHLNTFTNHTFRGNQMAGLFDDSFGNVYIAAQFDYNEFDAAITDDKTKSVFIMPWFEDTNSPDPKLGQRTSVFGTSWGPKPDLRYGASIMTATQQNGGGVLSFTEILAQPAAFEMQGTQPVRTTERDSHIWGTGSPTGFASHPTSWYMRDTDDLGTIAMGESHDTGWWCMRSYGDDSISKAGRNNSLCVADFTATEAPVNQNNVTRTWIPSGFYMGSGITNPNDSSHQKKVRFSVSSQSGPQTACAPGVAQVVYADSFEEGGNIGWVCTELEGWRPFGVVY